MREYIWGEGFQKALEGHSFMKTLMWVRFWAVLSGFGISIFTLSLPDALLVTVLLLAANSVFLEWYLSTEQTATTLETFRLNNSISELEHQMDAVLTELNKDDREAPLFD